MYRNTLNKSVSISLTIIILTGFILGCDAKELTTKPEAPTTLTKDDLVKALEDLRDAMIKKIDIDIDDTAIAFTIVKDYWRTKRLADIFRAPLKVIEGTITSLTSISDLINLSSEVNKQLTEAKTNYQALSIVMMIQNLKEVGGKLYYGLYGPTYISSIENMLDAADETTIPPLGFSKEHYKRVIENYLFGVQGETILNIPRHSTDNDRKVIDYARGALKVRKSISKTFDDLIFDIKNKKLPEGFPLDEVITELKYLKEKVLKSTLNSTDLVYKTDFSDDVKITLGSLADRKKAWHIATGSLAKKLDIEIKVELLQAGNSILLTTTYIYPNVDEIKIAQKVTTLSSTIIKPYVNSFHTDPEGSFYMLPQEMLLSLPFELSNLWMIADDIDNYLRYLMFKELEEEIAEETGEEITEETKKTEIGKIAFESDRDGNWEIYIMNSDGSEQTRLTNNPATDWNPTWSPDGKKIEFDSDRDGNYERYVMNSDGSEQTNLTNNPSYDEYPVLSPDGKKIAFHSKRDGNYEIYVINFDGSEQTNLTNNPATDVHHVWSPNSKKIAFESTRDGDWEIYVINADGSEQTNLTNNPASDWSPTWSPDGKKIAFDSDRDGDSDIYVMNADGSEQTRLTHNPANDWADTWSPDGKKIAFYSDRDGNYERYVMNSDGSEQTRLTNNPAYDEYPVWSPDRKKIAFVSDRDGNYEIYVTNSYGSELTRLTNNPAYDLGPAWSPDGKKIAFESVRDGDWEIYVMNTDGSELTRLTNNPATDRNPAWSPH